MNKRFSTKVALVLISTSTMLPGCYRQPREDEQQNGTNSTSHTGIHYFGGSTYRGGSSTSNPGATHTTGTSATNTTGGSTTHTSTAGTSSSARSGFGSSAHSGSSHAGTAAGG